MSVLICYDGSPSSRLAVASAAAMLAQSGVSRDGVTLLHVWHQPRPATDSFSYRGEPQTVSAEELTDGAANDARELLEAGRDLATEHGLTPELLTAPKQVSVAATILRVAEQQSSSLIVLGAHPHGTPGPTLDSVSAAVIAASSRPVLVIPMTAVDQAALAGIAGDDEVERSATSASSHV